MKNLVEQASQWLQSEACRSGNILERTIAVVACFRKYVVEEFCTKHGVDFPTFDKWYKSTHKKVHSVVVTGMPAGEEADGYHRYGARRCGTEYRERAVA